MIVNRINRPKLPLAGNETASILVLLVEEFVERCSAIDETETAGDIRRKAAEWIAPGQCEKAAAGKIGLCRQTDTFNAGAEISAPEIFYVETAAPRVIPGKQFVLTDLA